MEDRCIVLDGESISISTDALHKLEYYGIDGDFNDLSILGDFSCICDGAFQDSKIKSLYIDDGIYIGKYAFNNCRNLQHARLPKDLGVLESSTFENCISLSSVDNLKNIYSLKNNAFDGCKSLVSVDVSNVSCIGDSAFGSCCKLSDLVVSDKLSIIGHDGFINCDKLLSLDVPSHISFKISTFDEDLRLHIFGKHNDLEDYYNSMVSFAIENRKDYVTQTLIDRLDDDKFISSDTQYELAISGISYVKPCKYEHNYNISSIVMSDEIVEIGDFAFHRCHNLKKIKFSKNLKKIGKFAFGLCMSLQNVDFPISLDEIGTSGFNKCPQLLSVDLKNVSYLGKDAFSDCMNMETAILNKCTLDYMAFADCINLKTLIANDVCKFTDLSFIDCISINNVKNKKIIYLDGAQIFEFNVLKKLVKRISRLGNKIMLLPYREKV